MRFSAYTILGLVGYAAANVVGIVLARVWELTATERLIGFFAPGIAFILVVAIATAIVGRERIVFYQTAVGGIALVALLGLATGARVARLVDLTTLGIGVFLVFGRIGCHAVACCHGTITHGHGVTYGPAHVALGFWSRWSGRTLWPVQLVEAIASAVFVSIGIAVSAEPGRATVVYALAYSTLRFALELVRGDSARPYRLGLSEAQWLAVAVVVACAVWQRSAISLAIAGGLVVAAGALVITRRRRELFIPPHLRELDRAMTDASDGLRHATSLGVGVSRHALPDGRVDWVLSSDHPMWSEAAARRLGHAMFREPEIVIGRAPGVIHVIAT